MQPSTNMPHPKIAYDAQGGCFQEAKGGTELYFLSSIKVMKSSLSRDPRYEQKNGDAFQPGRLGRFNKKYLLYTTNIRTCLTTSNIRKIAQKKVECSIGEFHNRDSRRESLIAAIKHIDKNSLKMCWDNLFHGTVIRE
uniref:Uncharacterized protein n=1 Tax=Romanomermis culicivorax TaxID=13658 RepID=A0A915HTB0_ROMCU